MRRAGAAARRCSSVIRPALPSRSSRSTWSTRASATARSGSSAPASPTATRASTCRSGPTPGPRKSDALRELDRAIAANPELPIVTWSGTGADLPRIAGATVGLDLQHLREALHERHIDLFTWVCRSVRFPRPGLDLKTVAKYLGVPRLSPIRDGMEAEMLYGRYLDARNGQKRAELQAALCDYNRDDLDSLIGVARRLHELHAASATS